MWPGTANVFACTWVGATQVVLPRFDAAAVLAAIEREAITHTVLVPTMLAMLLDAPEFGGTDLGSLRNVQYAASPIAPELQRRVLERLPCEIAQFYGMTEAAPTVSHLTPDDHRQGGRRRRVDGRAGAGRAGRGQRPARRPAAARRGRRAVDPRAEHHARLLEPPGRDGGGARRRLVPLRGHRLAPTRTATSTWSTERRT